MSVHFDPHVSQPTIIQKESDLSDGMTAPPSSPACSQIHSHTDSSLELVVADRMRQKIVMENSKELFSDKPRPSMYWHALFAKAYGALEELPFILSRLDSKLDRTSFDFDLFDQTFIDTVKRSPQTLSSLGLMESIQIYDHNAMLDDVSAEALYDRIHTARRLLKEFQMRCPSTIEPSHKTSYESLCWLFEHQVQGEPFLLHSYHINQMFGVLFDLTQTFLQHHKLDNEINIQNYLLRLRKIPEQIGQAVKFLDLQEENGILPPRVCVEKVIKQIQSLIPEEIESHLYFTHLKQHTTSSIVLGEAKAILRNEVYPASQNLLERYEKLLEKTTSNHGVGALPRGTEFYQYALKGHTTTDLTPDQIHDMGVKEVERIHQQMRTYLAKVGIENPNVSPGVLMQELQKKEDLYFPDTEQGRKDCLAEIERILERCRKELWPLFGLTPKAPVEVRPVPAHEEDGMPGAYYCDPSLDGSRPGYYYINLRSMKELPRFGLETLSVHEAEPGHHFQDTIRNELSLPLMMKTIGFTSSQEGWALYVEKLAFEQGFFTSDYSVLGHLQDEILRAVRLVVDTGLHAKGWPREKAIDYMIEVTGFTRETVETEVDRYLVMPGQACAYKVGQLKILELRQQARDALGSKFELKDFHNAILQAGIVPLPVLERAIEKYIASMLDSA